MEQKERRAHIRTFKAAARKSRALGNEASGVCGGEMPNRQQADQSSNKANHENVGRVAQEFVGVGHNILHQHEENVVSLSDSLCGISHTANRLSRERRKPDDTRLTYQ